ncbi:hypothetical protein [Rufibacter roseus]|uniref:Uncharacterized protein n=1 Tax=Rufibacter roseus TaxID=1567108 RepID=A0ABW2DPS6_9BACT|nr:hypothetical protein [Rufibacter roseus]
MKLEQFSDLDEALAYLRQHHYLYSFKCSKRGWRCIQTNDTFFPEELSIDACHRFRQCGGAHTVAVLYAVSTPCGKRGLILDNCSTYGNPQFGDFLVRMKLQQMLPSRKNAS